MKSTHRHLLSYSTLVLALGPWACGGNDAESTTTPPATTSASSGSGSMVTGPGAGSGQGGSGQGGSGQGGSGQGGEAPGQDKDGDGSLTPDDCDDTNADTYPSATEICDGADNDCDEKVDEGVTTTFFADADGDGFGIDDAATNASACSPPSGFAPEKGDCDDQDAARSPGTPEICDGKDNDCISGVDNGVEMDTYFKDADGDGVGGDSMILTCTPPDASYVTSTGDCNDNDKAIFPGNAEICDGKDNDCSAMTLDPGSTTWYEDYDNDGYGATTVTQVACKQPFGFIAQGGDCQDADKYVNPGASELCDGIDNNCINGIDEGATANYLDFDGDGFGDAKSVVQMLCKLFPGRSANNLDCDDTKKSVNPDATEIPGNKVDENCDGSDNTAGELCGYKSLSATTLPFGSPGYFGDPLVDKSNGGPAGNGFYYEDYEISTTAGLTFTVLEAAIHDAALTPRLYLSGANGCLAGAAVNGLTQGNPNGASLAAVTVTNAMAGYYAAYATTALKGQMGSYRLDVLPGNVGGSCGEDTFRLWPHGARVVTKLTSAPVVKPAPNSLTEDVETYLQEKTTYTALMGASNFTDVLHVTDSSACGTSLATSNSGILNGGARLVFSPATAGVYTFWGTGSTASFKSSFALNVVEGNVGESCFAGNAAAGGTGDQHVLWPLGGTVSEGLALGDRIGDMLVNRLHDDFEMHLEAGEKVSFKVTRTGGSAWTPKIYLTRAGACTTPVASSSEMTGIMGKLTYTVPNTGAGIYTLVVTSSAESGVGTYTIASSYN